VSIVVVNFNYGRYLGEAIESALAQTYEPLEVLVVDDGSTDDSVAVAERYPVELVRQENAGVSHARNCGARRANGQLLVFLDADDLLEPDYVARCWQVLSAEPATVAYAYTTMRLFGTEEGIFESRDFSARFLVCDGNFIHASALMRREAFDQAGGFDPSWALGYEDYELYVRMLNLGYSGVLLDEPLLCYRRHGQSRNVLTDEQLQSLLSRLACSYPRLFWRRLLLHPLRVLFDWRRHGAEWKRYDAGDPHRAAR
jgi:glycosyltransferase involved in cell wall biosynthesis